MIQGEVTFVKIWEQARLDCALSLQKRKIKIIIESMKDINGPRDENCCVVCGWYKYECECEKNEILDEVLAKVEEV